MYQEIPLGGGDVTEGVVRVGDTVRRPRGPGWAGVHSLLNHLETVGFDGAPRVLGIDEQGREILSFVEGEAPGRPLPSWAVTEEALAGVARLLRRYHDAVASFAPPADARWDSWGTSNHDVEPELIGHCDVTPENVVFRQGVPAALIDFDLARPASRLFEVVTAVRHWAPLDDPGDRDPSLRDVQVGDRIRIFCDAYGLADRNDLLSVALARFERSYEAMRLRARTRGGGWARMWDEGAGERILRARAWLQTNFEELNGRL